MVDEPQDSLLSADNPIETTQWYSEEYKEVVSQKGWENADSVLKSYSELEKSTGSKIKLPTPESSKEEISAFYDKIGRPVNAEGYELARPDLPEGMTYDEGFEKAITAIAYEEGISKQQLQVLSKAFNEYQVNEFTNFSSELQRTQEEGERSLKEEWGAKYDENLEVAKRACKELGSDEFTQLLVESKIGNNPVFIKTFRDIGLKIMDDTLIRGASADKTKEEYKPQYPNSPEQYRNDTSEEGEKARAWFKARGIEV